MKRNKRTEKKVRDEPKKKHKEFARNNVRHAIKDGRWDDELCCDVFQRR
jgi:hypothetical protein